MTRKAILTTVWIALLFILGGLIAPNKINVNFRSNAQEKSEEFLLAMPLPKQISVDQRLIDANTNFSFKLFSEILREDRDQNVFVSPASVAIALSMAYNGASGTTKKEMAEALEFQGMSLPEINAANQALRQALLKADPEVQLSIANSLWAREDFSFKHQFLKNNRKFYDAQVTSLNFASPEAIEIINRWVDEKTRGKIDQIIESIQPEDVLFLINAIYFKGNWTNEFDKNLTTEKPFYLSNGSSKEHPMMSASGEYRYYENEQFQAVSLPYGEGSLSMYIFLPREDSNLDAFSGQLTSDNWNQWMSQFRSREGSIQIPRFKLEYEVELNRALKALGMEAMFDSSRADFSQMTSDPVKVDTVKHKTFVEVNEEGTEAAAVTSIGIRTTSVSQPFTMIVERPFFCAIRDNQTETILFMGAIVEPE